MKSFKDIFHRLRLNKGAMIVVLAAVLIELTSATMYWFARKSIQEEVVSRAELELKVKNLEIQKMMVAVETATNNSVWSYEQRLKEPDSLATVSRQLVVCNPNIIGVGLVFTADYYPEKGRWFEPYVALRDKGTLDTLQIGGPDHDYLQSTWFKEAIKKGSGYWSEPYYDEAGAKAMLCTYFAPIRDTKGRIVALVGADVSLNWLSSVINASHINSSSYNVMISRTGKLMVYPVDSLVMNSTIQQATAHFEDTMIRRINRQMMAGENGQATLTNEEGDKEYVFFAPVEGRTGWSMAVVCSDSEIYRSLRQVGFNLRLLMLAGLVLLSYILWRSARNARRLQASQGQKVALEKELHIASSIQMSLLPKTFPPFPERTDVDIHATLLPAREVGGDLYDFYIRDEKLFFCIGDVSGKGVPASLVMAITRTLFRNVTSHESKPKRILGNMNDMLSVDNPDSLFVTFFVGVLDLPTGLLRYACAGHNAPLLIGKGKMDCKSNVPLGIMPGWEFTQHEMTLDDDAMIFLYTDGLNEAMNADETLFGKQRMKQVANEVAESAEEHSPRHLIEVMNEAVQSFVNGAKQSDDLTMLAIRYKREKTAVRLSRSITLPNDIHTVPQLNAFMEEVCHALGADATFTMQTNLAVEEAVVNVMNYAYPKGKAGEVGILAEADNERLKVTISDNGTPFDPTAHPPVDTTLSLEERPIGGLGIHLIRQYMDSINYERVDTQNVLTLHRRLP